MSCRYCDEYIYAPDYYYVACANCGAITLDGSSRWKSAQRMTFKNMYFAEFYIKNGYRANDDKPKKEL